MVHKIMRTHAVAAVLAPAEFPPLRFFNLPGNRCKNDIALELYARTLQSLHREGVTDQRAFHVVDAEAVNHSVFDYGVGLVANSSQEFFPSGVGSIHMAVKHQAAASASAFPARDDVGAPFLDFLPGNI